MLFSTVSHKHPRCSETALMTRLAYDSDGDGVLINKAFGAGGED
jgi:hypothetical protein